MKKTRYAPYPVASLPGCLVAFPTSYNQHDQIGGARKSACERLRSIARKE